jgi:hypothetical protein
VGSSQPKTIYGADCGSPPGRKETAQRIFEQKDSKASKIFWFSADGERSGNQQLPRGAISENKLVDSGFEHRLVRVDQQTWRFVLKVSTN